MPPLSVILPAREGLHEIERVLDALLPQARRTGAEVLVVGPMSGPAPECVRLVRVDDGNIFRMRMLGIQAARGEVVAIGEDHAVPRPDWCDAVIRAHAERPEAPAIAGCLANGTDRTLSGRANFLAFSAAYEPPMPELPSVRPPPASTLSVKRSVLASLGEQLGEFETALVPRLFAEGKIVADDRIVTDHYQDHGVAWAIVNSFHAARAGYGYQRAGLCREERLSQARWSLVNWPPRVMDEVRGVAAGRKELAVIALVAAAAGVGGAVGSLTGPGRSPVRVA
jgi:hypothetical protein